MPADAPTTGLRTIPQRILNTLAYEAGAILIVGPMIALITHHSAADSIGFLIALSLAFVFWAFVHNLIFDLIEQACGGGPASARNHKLRICHALSLEVSSILVTLPVVMVLGGYSFWEAVVIDVGLSLIYAAYAYVFHLGYDRIYPVPPTGDNVASNAAM